MGLLQTPFKLLWQKIINACLKVWQSSALTPSSLQFRFHSLQEASLSITNTENYSHWRALACANANARAHAHNNSCTHTFSNAHAQSLYNALLILAAFSLAEPHLPTFQHQKESFQLSTLVILSIIIASSATLSFWCFQAFIASRLRLYLTTECVNIIATIF